MLLDYGAYTNETPPGTDTPAYGHAVSNIGANGSLELHLNYAALTGAGDDSHCCGCADIISILEHKPYEVPHQINRIAVQLSVDLLKKYAGKFALEADESQTVTLELIDGKLFNVDPNGEKTELHPDSETTFFESPTTKDGYLFTLNPQTNQYELTIISTGLELKAKRLKSEQD